MRFLAAFGLLVVSGVVAASDDRQQAEEGVEKPKVAGKRVASEVTVVEPNKSYVVKLDCLECPFAVWDSSSQVSWQTPPQDNALLLNFEIDVQQTALLLNGRRVLPLDPMPLDIKATQIAANQISEVAAMDGLEHIADPLWSPQKETAKRDFWLQYEHSLLRDREPDKFWVQFDVTGWIVAQNIDPVQMDKAGQKLVQVLLRKETISDGLRIEEVQVVDRKDRMQPYRMKCGNLAIIKTSYNPNEWDKYGKFGTWPRLVYLVLGKLGDFWSNNFEQNAHVFILALWLAITVFLVRRWHQARKHEKTLAEDDAEIALPSYQYSIIPVIKIEEYD